MLLKLTSGFGPYIFCPEICVKIESSLIHVLHQMKIAYLELDVLLINCLYICVILVLHLILMVLPSFHIEIHHLCGRN